MIQKSELASSLPFKEQGGLMIANPQENITLGYSSKRWGDAREKSPSFDSIDKIYHQPQKHTNLVVEVPSGNSLPPFFDGSLTKDSFALLKGSFADCLPLYFYSLKDSWIGLVHSGWQGSFEGIAKIMVEIFAQKGLLPSQIGCVMGPYRSFFYYEVKRDFRDFFFNKYSTSWIKDCFQERNGKYFFDNGVFNLFLMRDLGVEELFFLDLDMGYHEEFFSHRRGDVQRNVAFIFKEDRN